MTTSAIFFVEVVVTLYKHYIFHNGDDKLMMTVMPLNSQRNANQSTENVGID